MTHEDSRHLAIARRDAALTRASRARQLLIGGSAAVSAVAAGLISTAPPGKASTASTAHIRPTGAPPLATAAAPALPPLQGPRELGLRPPDRAPGSASGGSDGSAAPAAAPAPPPAPVSGGS